MSSALRSLAIILLAGALSGCSLPYYLQAIGGQLELLRKRQPIESVIADAGQDAAVKTTLSRVAEMREFAVNALALPDNDSYTTYVDLDRPYAVWNVIAADEFSVRACAMVLSVRGLRGLQGVLRPRRRRTISTRARRGWA